MKIGILTFHRANNYGAILQAFSLQRTIINMGHQVELIDYHQPYIITSYSSFYLNFKNLKSFIMSFAYSLIHFPFVLVKNHKFNSFRNNYMTISAKKYHYGQMFCGYDACIVGSDQVWNGDITNFDTTFFLSNLDQTTKKISYAASFGKDNLTSKDFEYIKNNINQIQYISIRESKGADLVKGIIGSDIDVVLDPTLLSDFSFWNQFLTKPKSNDSYILVYMIHPNIEVLNIANLISIRLNIKVKYIKDSIKKTKYGFKNSMSVGPIEFINLINNADFIVTNSFHGTAFSILFNKNFITVPHNTMGERMMNLLHLLNLEGRLINQCDKLSNDFELEINYELPNRILDVERVKSLNFLRKSLEVETNNESNKELNI